MFSEAPQIWHQLNKLEPCIVRFSQTAHVYLASSLWEPIRNLHLSLQTPSTHFSRFPWSNRYKDIQHLSPLLRRVYPYSTCSPNHCVISVNYWCLSSIGLRNWWWLILESQPRSRHTARYIDSTVRLCCCRSASYWNLSEADYLLQQMGKLHFMYVIHIQTQVWDFASIVHFHAVITGCCA